MPAPCTSQPPSLALAAGTCAARLSPAKEESADPPPVDERARQTRFQGIVQNQLGFVWRSLRRLGIPPVDLEDAAQEIFVVASRRLDDIEIGHERGFLFKTCVNYASRAYRTRMRRRRVEGEALQDVADPRPGPDALADQAKAKQLCFQLLARMDLDLRAVFVLYEIERFTMAEIADTLDVPAGTVASRLRRARQMFLELVQRTVVSKPLGGTP